MEKYAKLMKGLEVCAGPDCCKDGCPYYGETTGGVTCRARLLMDARIAIDNEMALHESAEEYIAHRNEDVERLQADAENREAAYKTIHAERDKLRTELDEMHAMADKLIEERTVLQNEVHSLRMTRNRLEMLCQGKTDRPSVCDRELMEDVGKLIAQAKYQEGRADALAEIVERCSFGGGGRHE